MEKRLSTHDQIRDRELLDNEDLAYEYFRLIMRKDTRQLLHLFTEDAAIDEPFIKPEARGSRVNTLIMPAMRIYDLLNHASGYEKSRIEEQCIDCYYNKNHVMCTFRRGQEIIIRFIFKFGYDSKDNRRIKCLRIELIR